ncbi:MAG: M23 family metallopeptidase [Pseudomonadota bacterium]
MSDNQSLTAGRNRRSARGSLRPFSFDTLRLSLAIVVLATACSSDAPQPPADPLPTPREIYLETLIQDPQAFRALATQWEARGDAALAAPLAVDLPYLEFQSLGPGHNTAAAWSFELDVYDVLELEARRGAGARGAMIVDVLRRVDEGWMPVLSLPPNQTTARYRPDAAGEFAVRAQPTLDSAGKLALALKRDTVLQFPVQTDSKKSVLSFFGAARDAGRRQHHGIDIFAARGTPVLAALDGLVSRVAESPKGGLHIWQRSAEGSLYYAHLDSVVVEAGDLVTRGQVIGGVGNTGNARTTYPHLHFGVYQRWHGPVDPLPLTGRARIPDPWPEDLAATPRWLASQTEALTVRAAPKRAGGAIGQLENGELVSVRARSGSWVRVVTGAGAHGFVAARYLGPPQRTAQQTDAESALHLEPVLDSPELTRLRRGTTVTGKGRFGEYLWVETDAGVEGWLRPQPEATPPS